jgi:hypothetical protein
MAIASLLIFMFSLFVLSTRRIGKAGVLSVVKRCVYFALHMGKKETSCYKYIYIFLKRLRERRLKRGRSVHQAFNINTFRVGSSKLFL